MYKNVNENQLSELEGNGIVELKVIFEWKGIDLPIRLVIHLPNLIIRFLLIPNHYLIPSFNPISSSLNLINN